MAAWRSSLSCALALFGPGRGALPIGLTALRARLAYRALRLVVLSGLKRSELVALGIRMRSVMVFHTALLYTLVGSRHTICCSPHSHSLPSRAASGLSGG